MSIPKFQVQRNLTPTSTIAISGSPDYVGTYGSGTTYATGDVVTYNGSSYVARQATTGNTPGETAYWQTLASQGNTGAQGPTGAQGAAGAAGTNGVINTLTAGTNLNGGGSAATVTVNLDSSISLTSATFSAGSPLIFEGATPDAHETTIAITDPTGDRTVTIPDGSGTIAYLDSNITGNAATATTATTATNVTATANNTADETVYLTFVDGATGSQGVETDTGLNYNPSSGVLTTTSVTGNLTGNVTGNTSGTSGSTTGNAATATALATARNIGGVSFDGTASINLPGVNTAGSQDTSGTAAEATNVTATANNTADETVYLTFVDGATGTQGIETDTGLNYNPNSGVLTTTSVTGNLTGNVTGNVSGSAGSATGNAATATEATNVTATANNTANETVYLTFVDGATGTQGIETDTGLNYNPSTGVLTTTSVTGNLTGNVTGNTSGSSGSTTGNAATATALATARAINGVDFDGTGAITVTAAAGTLTGTELKSTVVTSSLTSVGTLSALTVSGTVTMDSVGITAVQTSAESFADNDTSLMTSAAIDDKINAAGGGGAAGSNTQVQYNSSGSFAGSANLTFNGTTLTANAFSGPLTGDVTGNVSGTAATVTGAAQSNITSVGTLTGLTVGGTTQPGTDAVMYTEGVVSSYNPTTSTTGVLIKAYSDVGGTESLKFDVRADGDITTKGKLTIDNGSAITPNSSWNSHLKIAGNGYSGGLSLDDTGMWIGHNSSSRTIIFATNETSIASFSASGSTDFSLHGGTGTGYTQASLKLSCPDDNRGAGMYMFNAALDKTWYAGMPYTSTDRFIMGRSDASTLQNSAAAASGALFEFRSNGAAYNTTGTWGNSSDVRMKGDIETARSYLTDLNQLRIVTYKLTKDPQLNEDMELEFVDRESPSEKMLGLIAQEVESVFPAMVTDGTKEAMAIKQSVLIPMLITAVQELTTRVATLEGG